ncbi:MAG TPA: YraN family protein [Pyrinomonadaceae bacterium]|nr:YraN family protein [Pyrinomonadaceae bacterium]
MDSSQSKSPTVTIHKRNLGRLGEEYARAYLEQRGYRIVAGNFTVPVGRNLRGAIVTSEIDLVAYDGPTLCFVEVKTRASDWFAPPQVNIDRRKQRQISRAARAYRRMFGLIGERFRFDVVTVILPGGRAEGRVQIKLLRNFWTDKVLRKARREEWYYD